MTTGHMMVMPGAKVNPLPPQGPNGAGQAHAAAPVTQATTQGSTATAAADQNGQKGGNPQ
jgi:hypothetical protein